VNAHTDARETSRRKRKRRRGRRRRRRRRRERKRRMRSSRRRRRKRRRTRRRRRRRRNVGGVQFSTPPRLAQALDGQLVTAQVHAVLRREGSVYSMHSVGPMLDA
jgi:hypothetical protein